MFFVNYRNLKVIIINDTNLSVYKPFVSKEIGLLVMNLGILKNYCTANHHLININFLGQLET